jgi:ribosomal protein S18 acetylase RimI-like enzyme
MNKNIVIKRIDSTDWADYKEIKTESIKEESSAFGTTLDEIIKYKDEYWIEFLNDTNNIVLIAYDKSKPIGLIRAALIDNDVEIGTAFIGSLYVNANYRNSGLGLNLMKNLLKQIEIHKEIIKVRLWVKPSQDSAILIYKKLDFYMVLKDHGELIFEKIIK